MADADERRSDDRGSPPAAPEGGTPNGRAGEDDPADEDGPADTDGTEPEGVRETAVEGVDQRIVDLLSWILDTETRAKIYVHLLVEPRSTSEEVATGTGLYPSTVREALAELYAEGRVTREKRESAGAGNNPYEYTAIQPSELVGGVADRVQRELNTIFRLDRILGRRPRGRGRDRSRHDHDRRGSAGARRREPRSRSRPFGFSVIGALSSFFRGSRETRGQSS